MKKVSLFLFCGMFCAMTTFGQTPNPPIWTTVGGSSVRNISMNSVRAETLSLANQYKFFGIEDESRNTFRARLTSEGNGPLLRSWLEKNQNFVFALHENTNLFGIIINLASITFVKGDRVYTLHFHPNSSSFSSNSIQNDRRYLEQLIDSYLAGMVSSPNSSQTPDNRPTFTVVNRTGSTITGLYVVSSTSDNWGTNILNNSLSNDQSITIILGQQLNVVNRYDIGLIDTAGNTYTKIGVIITQNVAITFTIADKN